MNNGIGFFGGLQLLLIAAKLFGAITWSWAMVTLPIWGMPVVMLIGLVIYVIYMLLTE